MDVKVRNRVAEIQQALEQEEQRISHADPVAKMMLVALAHQTCELERKIDESEARLARKFSDEVLLHANIQASPAITIVHIENGSETMPYYIDEMDIFTSKSNKCNYRPIYRTRIVPGHIAACFVNNKVFQPSLPPIPATWPDSIHKHEIWIAYDSLNEVKSLEDLSIAFTHPLPSRGLVAEVGDVSVPLTLMLEEAPPTLGSNFILAEFWKRSLVTRNFWLYRFGHCQDKRVLRRGEIPAWIRDSYDSEILEPFVGNQYLWIRIKADSGISVPDSIGVDFNYLPLVNYDINDEKLSYAEPIKSLENDKTCTYFLGVSHNQEIAQEYFIRDFDVTQYDNERIREDVTSLYHHYVNDYFAFVDNNALHDGAVLRQLRQSMMQVYDSLDEYRTGTLRPYGGVYAIRNPRNNQQPIVITYFTTNGARGNELNRGYCLSSTNAAVGKVEVIIDAFGGRDKVKDEHTRNELARYSANSCDRLFTRMDLLQFCKVELMRAFGEDALRSCNVNITENTVPVENHIEKCLTIHFNFNSDNLRQEVRNSDFFKYLEINIDLRKSFSWRVILRYDYGRK